MREACDRNELLLDNKTEDCHTLTANASMIQTRRTRPSDIDIMSLHQSTKTTQDVNHNLARTIEYMTSPTFLPLILAISKSGVIEWCTDASFAVHADMKSRSCIWMNVGKGYIYVAS